MVRAMMIARVVALALVCGLTLATRLNDDAPVTEREERVLIELFKMSRCPDAIRAENYLAPVLARMHGIIEVRFHYVATYNGTQVTCKHGSQECEADKQQLCVQAIAGSGRYNYQSLWEFVLCQGKSPDSIGDSVLAESCMKQYVPVSMATHIRRCYNSPVANGMLLNDVVFTQSLGVTKSCTIFIERQLRCIHDGNTWYDCDQGHEEQDFVDTICAAYLSKTGQWPRECGDEIKRGMAVKSVSSATQ